MIRVQYHLESQDTEETSLRMEANEPAQSTTDGHGFNEKGAIACCRRSSDLGLVDCSACLDEGWSMLQDVLDSNSCDAANGLLMMLRQSNGQGIKKSEIMVSYHSNLFLSSYDERRHQNSFASSTSNLSAILNRLLGADIPQVYWVGYKYLVLVSAHHVARWCVAVSQNPLVYTFPRRWMDIKGQKVVDFWQAAVRAIMSTVIFRPGISQVRVFYHELTFD